MTEPVSTPELDKLSKIKDKSQLIGEFLDWLRSTKHYEIAEWLYPNEGEEPIDSEAEKRLYPARHGNHGLIEELLADFFQLNLKQIDAEKEAIYQQIKEQAKA